MSAYSVPFSDIYIKKGFNHRAVSDEYVAQLADSIEKHGLLSLYSCVTTYTPDGEVKDGKTYQVVDGEARHRALTLISKRNPDRFAEIAEGGNIYVNIFDDSNVLSKHEMVDRSVISNTWRNQLEPHEVYAEIVRRTNANQDQYEIAEIMHLQQPRVNEYLSFQKVCDKGHEAWKAGLVSNADMVRLAALKVSDQKDFLKNLSSAVEGAEGDQKAVKAAKAAARKALKQQQAESGETRAYANAGKPTRQTLASYVPHITLRAVESEDETEKAFFNAVAAAFQVMNGELAFDKLSPSKSYVTKKAASEAKKALAEIEAKAQAKAEKAAAKAEKAAAKAAKADKPAKAPKEPKPKASKKPAKKTAKKPAKKKPAKAAE